MRLTLALAAWAVAHPAGAGAQPPAPVPATTAASPAALAAGAAADPRLAAGLDAAALAGVRALVAEAAAGALPVEPLVARALAGVEAGATGPRVVGAVRSLAGRLAAARQALAPAVGDAEVVAGADALAVGVPASTLGDLRRAAPRRSVAVPLGVVAQLVARGVPAPRAAAAVLAMVRKGAKGEQLVALDAQVRSEVAAGASAVAALDAGLAEGRMVPPLSTAPGGSGLRVAGDALPMAPTTNAGSLSGGVTRAPRQPRRPSVGGVGRGGAPVTGKATGRP